MYVPGVSGVIGIGEAGGRAAPRNSQRSSREAGFLIGRATSFLTPAV